MQRCVHDVRYLLTAGRRRGWRTPLPGPSIRRQSDDQDVDYYADVDDIPSDIAEHPDDDDEDYRDELNLWAGRQGHGGGPARDYAQSPRFSRHRGGAGADADDPLGDAFGPWEDAEPSSDDRYGGGPVVVVVLAVVPERLRGHPDPMADGDFTRRLSAGKVSARRTGAAVGADPSASTPAVVAAVTAFFD